VLSILGYRVTGPNGTENQNIADEVREMVWRAPEEFDVFQENPWPVLCREVDERYPSSLLTRRPTERWIKSIWCHFNTVESPMRLDLRHRFAGWQRRPVRGALRTSQSGGVGVSRKRSDGDLSQGYGWAQRCPFLGRKIPDRSCPHENRAEDRWKIAPLNALKSCIPHLPRPISGLSWEGVAMSREEVLLGLS